RHSAGPKPDRLAGRRQEVEVAIVAKQPDRAADGRVDGAVRPAGGVKGHPQGQRQQRAHLVFHLRCDVDLGDLAVHPEAAAGGVDGTQHVFHGLPGGAECKGRRDDDAHHAAEGDAVGEGEIHREPPETATLEAEPELDACGAAVDGCVVDGCVVVDEVVVVVESAGVEVDVGADAVAGVEVPGIVAAAVTPKTARAPV